MRIVLEIVAGSQTGRKVRLGAGQELRIGRTEWADFSVPEDGQMSSVHFALLTDGVACYVQDLESSNGTFVNGEQITARTVLRDGDEILAGQTRFRIHAEGDAPQRAEPAAVREFTPGIGSAPPLAALSQTPQASGQITYSVEKCDSGLTLYRGHVDEISPEELATQLGQVYPVYLIVDFKNLGTPPPAQLETPDYLFDWLDPAVLAMASPVVLSQADLLGWPDLVKQGWGADAVMCLYSKQEKPALLQHLRSMVRTKTHGKDESSGIVGFCWPSVMAPLLSHFEPAFVQRLLEGVEAVLVELPDLPITWQLYGDKQLVDVLDKFGFVQTPPEQNGSKPRVPET